MVQSNLFIHRSIAIIFVVFLNGYTQVDEYVMKAVAIEKLSRYIEWPETHGHSSSDSIFTIMVLGEDPFNGVLERIYRNKSIKNRNVKIQYVSPDDDISSCQILYLSESVKKKIKQTIRRMRGKPVLLMGETGGYAQKGVHIRVYVENNRIKFEINRKETVRSGITISSKLLNMAKIIDSE